MGEMQTRHGAPRPVADRLRGGRGGEKQLQHRRRRGPDGLPGAPVVGLTEQIRRTLISDRPRPDPHPDASKSRLSMTGDAVVLKLSVRRASLNTMLTSNFIPAGDLVDPPLRRIRSDPCQPAAHLDTAQLLRGECRDTGRRLSRLGDRGHPFQPGFYRYQFFHLSG